MCQKKLLLLIIPILFVNVIFVVIAFGINKKNAKYLLAGYNTMSTRTREKFDIDGYLIFFKKYFLQVAFFSTLIFLICSLSFSLGAAIILYTLSIILPIPYFILKGNRFNT